MKVAHAVARLGIVAHAAPSNDRRAVNAAAIAPGAGRQGAQTGTGSCAGDTLEVKQNEASAQDNGQAIDNSLAAADLVRTPANCSCHSTDDNPRKRVYHIMKLIHDTSAVQQVDAADLVPAIRPKRLSRQPRHLNAYSTDKASPSMPCHMAYYNSLFVPGCQIVLWAFVMRSSMPV